MAKKSVPLSELDVEALLSRKKAIQGVMIVIGSLMLGYIGYFIYLLATDSFDPGRHVLLLVPFFAMIATSSPLWMVRAKILAELKKRNPA